MEDLGLRNNNSKLLIANLEDKEVNIHALKLGLKLWSCQGWKWCVNDLVAQDVQKWSAQQIGGFQNEPRFKLYDYKFIANRKL